MVESLVVLGLQDHVDHGVEPVLFLLRVVLIGHLALCSVELFEPIMQMVKKTNQLS